MRELLLKIRALLIRFGAADERAAATAVTLALLEEGDLFAFGERFASAGETMDGETIAPTDALTAAGAAYALQRRGEDAVIAVWVDDAHLSRALDMAAALGLPLIMPASGYTSSVIPILLMVWFGSKVERWAKKWIPASMKMFFVPLITVTITVVLGYLVIGPIATLITNLLGEFFAVLFGLPMIGSVLGCTLVGGFWMCLVIFGFHWSLVPIALVNLTTLGHDYILGSVIAHSFSLGAVLFAMYLKNKDEKFRGIALPAMISAFFFGVTEPAIYGIALPDKKAFINASIGSAVGGLIIGISGAVIYISGGLGVFNWLSFIDPSGVNGINHMIWAIVASLVGAAVGFALEFATYKPEASK